MFSLSDFLVNECDEGLEQDDWDADEDVDDEVGHDDGQHHDPRRRALEDESRIDIIIFRF